MVTPQTTETRPDPTIVMDMVHVEECPHCESETVMVGDPTPYKVKGKVMDDFHCLQCIADGGDCCSLSEFNRFPEEEPEAS